MGDDTGKWLLNETKFVDLLLGHDFYEVSGLNGVDELVLLPSHLIAEAEEVKRMCVHFGKANRTDEFSLPLGAVLYRVTRYASLRGTTFMLRQSPVELLNPRSLGLGTHILDVLLAPRIVGMVLIGGRMKQGKTHTAISVLVERVKVYGGLGVSIEDPIESNIEGRHGKGRVMQLEASIANGGYRERLRLAVRSGAELIHLAEIRDPVSAAEAVVASLNGHPIIATIHCDSPEGAVERLFSLAVQEVSEAASFIAKGLYSVVWQELVDVAVEQVGHRRRMRSRLLVVDGNDAVRTKIRERRFSALKEDVAQQGNASAWGSRKGL
jgi:Tfp pilus assembly pilus retraction ATPase PilT